MAGTQPYGHPLVVTGCTFPGCGAFPAEPCEQPLEGSKAGQLCSRMVCAEHQTLHEGRRLCAAHGRLAEEGDAG
jgi:hypothetical protein